MRKQLKAVSAEGALARILEALRQELIDASDDEISAAARKLRMNLEMPESAAFAGLTYPARPQLSDFFELEAFRQMRLVEERPDTPAPVPASASASASAPAPARAPTPTPTRAQAPQKVPRSNPARRVRKRRTAPD